MGEDGGLYGLLLDTYETEVLKTTGLWLAFPEDKLDWRPHEKSRTVLEQFEHQLQSESRWMEVMMGIKTEGGVPQEHTRDAFVERYVSQVRQRLHIMRDKPGDWWRKEVMFFDVPRSRAWIMLRRINHSTHHRGQLVVYLRLLGRPVPSVYGPTADTGGKVQYKIAA